MDLRSFDFAQDRFRGNDRLKIVDFYGMTEIVFTTGPFVAGVHEAEKQQTAEKLAMILISKLNEAAKAAGDGREQR